MATRIRFLMLLVVLVTHLFGIIANGQELVGKGTRPHVVVLSTGETTKADHPLLLGLRTGLKKLGYVLEKDILLSVPINRSYDELRATISQYTKKPVNLFITIGSTDTAIVKQSGLSAPIVFMPTTDPLGRGFVKSLAEPGTNLTGLAYDTSVEVMGKQMEIFKDIVPDLQRVFLLYEQTAINPVYPQSLPVLRKTSERLGLNLVEWPVTSHDAAVRAITKLPDGVDAGIFVLCTNFFNTDPRTTRIAIQKRIPYYGCPSQVRKFGALASYGPDLFYIGLRGAWYVNRILSGARPQELPVETPRKYELLLNVTTAASIGIKIPPEVLQRADRIIK